jgi:hypothetical protein
MTKEKSGITIGLGEGAVSLTYDEAVHLAHLRTTPGWAVLRLLLSELNNGTTVSLRDRTKTLEDLRFCQGQADAAGRIADIVEEEVPQWYNEGAVDSEESEGSGSDNA